MRKRDAALRSRVRKSYVVSTVSMALVLFLLGAVGYLMGSVMTTAAELRRSVTMIVELDDGITAERRDSIAAALQSETMVAEIKFISKDEKLADEEFYKAFAVDIKEVVGENPLPDSFDVTLSERSADRAALEAFIESTAAIEGIAHISYPEMFLEKMHSVLDTLQLVLLLFGGTMLTISLVLLSNTIRLTIISKRELIATMKLVGATKWFIMRPLVGKGALQGLCAGLLATVLFAAAMYGLNVGVPEMGIESQLVRLGIIAGAMVCIGMVVSVVFTLFAASKFVNMKSNNIHLY